MKAILVLSLSALLVAANASSSSSYSYPSQPPSFYAVPASVSYYLDNAYYYYAPDIYTIGSVVSTIELSSPSLSYVESVIESYEYYSPSIVSYFESYEEYPSQISDLTTFESEESEYYALASAVETLGSVEATNPSLASEQSTLQSVMQSDSSILSDLSEYTYYASPSVYSASLVIHSAVLTSPSIVTSVIALSCADYDSPSVSYAEADLSSSVYSLPSSVVSDVIDYISSPSTVAPSVVTYLYSYFPSAYYDAYAIVGFTYSHSSVVSDVTGLLYAASSVSSIISAVTTIESYQMPTLSFQENAINSVESSWLSATTDLQYLSYFAVTSASFGYALGYMEQTFYSSPAVAYAICYAIEYPSSVTDTQAISYEEMSHQSFVSALTEVSSFESAHPSYSSTISSIMPYLEEAETTEGTLLTAAADISEYTSHSTATASEELSTVFVSSPYVESALYYIETAAYTNPSLYEDELSLEQYAASYAAAISQIASQFTTTVPSSSVYYYQQLDAEYPSIQECLESLYGDESSDPWLSSYETSFIYAAYSCPYEVQDYDYMDDYYFDYYNPENFFSYQNEYSYSS